MGITLLWAAAPLHTLALESVQLPGSKKQKQLHLLSRCARPDVHRQLKQKLGHGKGCTEGT